MAKIVDLLEAILNGEELEFEPKTKTQAYLHACCEKTGCEGLPTPTTRMGALLYRLAQVMASEGGNVLFGNDGTIYTKNIVFPDTVTAIPAMFKTSMTELESVDAPASTNGYASAAFGNYSFPKLKTVKMGGSINLSTSKDDRLFSGSTLPALQTVEIGSIGNPCLAFARPKMFFTTAPTCDIVIYVDAETLADVPSGISNYAPFGNANATVIYKNSNTGEVISE